MSRLMEVNSDVMPYVQTSLAKDPSPDNDSSEKDKENVPGHASRKRRSKKKVELVVNVEELTSNEEPLTNIVTPSIAKRLQGHKGKTVAFEDSPSREVQRKDITPIKRSANKKPHDAISKVPLDNASLHYMKNAERWKYVIQKRVAIERELGKDALKCKEVMKLIEIVRLMNIVTHFGTCYKNLVKEFVVTIPDGCDDKKSVDYGKVYVKGNVVTFSPIVINKFLGRTDEPQAESEVTDDQVCKEIMAKQVRHWPNKGKLSVGMLSVKYAILHRIGTANWVPTNHTSTISTGVGKFIYVIGTKKVFDFGKYIFEQVLKQAFSTTVKMPIYFPSLICGIILNQHPGILFPIDSVKKKDSPLSLHYKLFAGTYIPDIVMTSSQAPVPATSKKSVIPQLKET
ncbi:uncharacterized protein LOC127136390 [Lathyrus oleraceus]|uniref:uncharacterized protein LOC127136390 n=1 Tax=Pisum sativum TaxID=3888 RepID=UPI0021CF3ACD|nr:uncharacterized protein LOC127136390 [Pisum sativum]